MNRRGLLSIYLLFSMAGLLTGVSGFILAAGHAARTSSAVLQGVRAQYAAESGAVFALEKIKSGGLIAETVEFSLDSRTKCKVNIRERAPSVRSRGEDTETGVLRYVQLQTKVEAAGDSYRVTVEDVGKTKW